MGAAATEIAVERQGDRLAVGTRFGIEKRLGRHQDAGEAVAALPGLMVDESGDERMRGIAGKAFGGLDFGASGLGHGHVAGLDGAPADDDGAGSAGAVPASEARRAQTQILSQNVEKRGCRLGLDRDLAAIDCEAEMLGQTFATQVPCRPMKADSPSPVKAG